MPRKRIQRPKPKNAAQSRGQPSDGTLFPVVGVGASAGGLEAFTQLLKALPLDTGMGFVLVQHLDPEHESALTQILSRATQLPVCEVRNNQPVEPNHVYVIPPDTNLTIEQGVLKLQPRPRTRKPHRPIDGFFESLAQDHRERAIGVVLSGTASDGTLGLEAIKAEGGITFAQDDSAKHDSMPRSAMAAGCVDLVLAPAAIAQELARIAKHPYGAGQLLELSMRGELDRAQATALGDEDKDDQTPLPSGGRSPGSGARRARAESTKAAKITNATKDAEEGYKKILLLLRSHSGVDFSLYKSTTIQRRITRRLVLCKRNTLDDYADFLRGNTKELDALYSDVLISVTSFFRNPEMFDALQRDVLPQLLKQRGDDPIRAWVLGCSTGQEAYSLAMSFVETADKAPRIRNLQVFATDLKDTLLDKARHGLYAKTLADDISPQRLRRFFVEEDGGYRVSKMLRDMVVFARQNVIADPPFSRMDLISCRNLLIYLEPTLQKKALPTFHYALKPDGFLLLGASESIGGFTDLFEPVDRKHKIYSKKAGPTPAFPLQLGRARGVHPAAAQRSPLPMQPEPPELVRSESAIQREADRVTVNQFAPPGVLINADLQVLQFRGPTGAYLEPPSGKASFDVLKMAREGLMLPLRAVINQARKTNKSARKQNVRVRRTGSGSSRLVNLEVIPLKNLRERCFLIMFKEADNTGGASSAKAAPSSVRTARPSAKSSSHIAELESELVETREYLQSLQEEHEAANEELQASNEEVQSANEELQSINEELETSKEELESANEELITVNEEMSNRNVELNRLNNDLVNLQTSTKVAIVLLGRELAIRRFSPEAAKQFDLLTSDVGRPISHLRHHLVTVSDAVEESPLDLDSLAAGVITSVHEREQEVRDKAGHWHSLRVRPYLTLDNKIDGAVLVLIDIDALKASEQAITAARDYAENTIATVRGPLLVLNKDMRIESANRAFYHAFHVNPGETAGHFIYELGNHQWDIPRLHELLKEILPQNTTVEDFLVEHEFESIGKRTMLLNARRIIDPQAKSERILLAIEDITERKRNQAAMAHLAAIVSSSDDAIISKNLEGVITSWNLGAEHLFGYLAGEIIGKPVTLLIPEDHLDEEPQILERIRRGAAIIPYDTVRRRKDGGLVKISLSVSPIFDATKRVIGAAKMARDITWRTEAEQRLRESEADFRMLADNMAQLAWTCDHLGNVTWYNRRWIEYTGLSFEEMKGWDWSKVQHPDHLERVVKRVQQSAATGEPWDDTFPLRAKDGSYRWFLSRAVPIRDDQGKIVRWFGTNTDITEQREMAEELRQNTADLSEINHRKNEFIAMLAHELRNPLAPIHNALQTLRRDGTSASAVSRATAMMERQVSQMVRLVDDLLDVSRISRGKIELRKGAVGLASIVQHAVEAARPNCTSQGIELTVVLPPQPLYLNAADPIRLAQVVGNLLNNACKFTDKAGRVWLTIKRDGGEVVICVRDSGIGIAADQLTRIFEMFMQVDTSLERSVSGLGIGLTLVKTLVEMHGGSVIARSEGIGRGSEFEVRLPGVTEVPAEQAVASVSEPAVITPRRILVVDDNHDAADSLAALLQLSDHETSIAYDGEQALQAAATFRPDVVLLDIGLPKLNGYEVARKLRQQPWASSIKLIALTGWGQEEDRQRSKDAGFDAHMVKPIELDALEKLLTDTGAPAAEQSS